MNARLQVSELTVLGGGGNRTVYRHPENSRYLIKVFRPDKAAALWGARMSFRERLRRLRQYELFSREIHEYLAAHASDRQALAFTQKIVGFEETDIGLGLVVEAAFGRDGNLAPTLATLIAEKRFDENARAALDRFNCALLASAVVISDLHWGNLVLAYTEEAGDHFVMIDGLGSSNLIPFKRYSQFLNRRSKLARVRRLERKISGQTTA